MARVTEDEVLKILAPTDLTEDDLTPYVRSANVLVSARLSGHYDADLLGEIELWLAAWFAGNAPATARAAGLTAETIGPVSQSYGGVSGMGLESNRFGQAVIRLDYKGILSKTQEADIQVLG